MSRPSDMRRVIVGYKHNGPTAMVAWFHCFGGLSEHAYAICESPKGHVSRYKLCDCTIQFQEESDVNA